ncbi:ABC transporter permease [Priestia megaterium]|uniref:ABC transporter permease n=1 Tax=Priestia megaterium TaxID=1404 RepID=UPI002E2068BF|nr:ABC transporter permease subunit [Priestia megaterium]MED3879739.1 ABC transporter permease subunit [Priestia megaterium]
MTGLFMSELERTFKRKKTAVVLGVYIGLLAFIWFIFFQRGGISFFDADHDVKIDSLNAAPLLLRDLSFAITFIVIPMFVADSFNGEYTSGALRMVLIRPHHRLKLFFVKWTVQCLLVFIILCITWVVGTCLGKIAMPHVNKTTFLGGHTLGTLGALLYSLKFYGICFCIFIAVISIGSILSVLMPNSILSYVVTMGALIGSVYVSDKLSFFFSVTDSVFHELSKESSEFLVNLLFPILLISLIINLFVWKKKDWVG